MFRVIKQDGKLKDGFNFYPLNAKHDFGFVFRWKTHIWQFCYRKLSKLWRLGVVSCVTRDFQAVDHKIFDVNLSDTYLSIHGMMIKIQFLNGILGS